MAVPLKEGISARSYGKRLQQAATPTRLAAYLRWLRSGVV
jgi:hypothetical protein